MKLYRIYKCINTLDSRRKCYICRKTFFNFLPYRKGNKGRSPFIQQLQMVGIILSGARAKERHLFMYFDALNLWGEMSNKNVLHFAPQHHLSHKIHHLPPQMCIQAALSPATSKIEQIDVSQTPYPDAAFHILIANHILEHIPQFSKALQ